MNRAVTTEVTFTMADILRVEPWMNTPEYKKAMDKAIQPLMDLIESDVLEEGSHGTKQP